MGGGPAMATENATPLLSYDDYMALPEGRHELIDGVLLDMTSPSHRHQWIQALLLTAFVSHARQQRLGMAYANFDVVLRQTPTALICQPDLVFVSRERAGILTAPNIQGVPDLIVEILSPTNARHDSVRKRRIYEEHGVREYWMVLSESDQLEVLRLDETGRFGHPVLFEAGDTLTTPLLPGLSIDVAELFEPDL